MRLDGQEESTNVEDRRGMGAKGGAALGGGGLIIVLLLAFFLKKDPGQIANQLNGGGAAPGQNGQVDPAEEEAARFTKIILGDTEKVWDEQFRTLGKPYTK